MKGKTTQKLFLVLLCLVLQEVLLGQTQKIHTLEMNDGTSSPSLVMNADALIDMQSSKKGLLLPRVSLTDAKLPAPLASHTAGMTVYNTATVISTASVEGVTPGYYYNNGTKWVRLVTDLETEWQDGTVSGTDLIYAKQSKKAGNDVVITDEGEVGIGKESPMAKLDINGNMNIVTPGSSYLGGKTGSSGINGTGQLAHSYHSFLRQKTSSGHVVNLGGLGDWFGFVGYDKDLAVNGLTHSLVMNLSNGHVGIGNITPQAKLDVKGNVRFEDGTATAPMNTDALVQLDSKNKGLLLPRVSLTDAKLSAPLASHTAGMIVYNTATVSSTASVEGVIPGYYYNNGTKWVRLATESEAWTLKGNAGTNSITNFIGTTDNQALNIRTNNTNKVTILPDGKVGVGTTAPRNKFDVSGRASADSYFCYSRNLITEPIYHPAFIGLARASGTYSSPGYVKSGNVLCAFVGRDLKSASGHSGAVGRYGGGSLYIKAAEDYSDTRKGALMDFSTTPNGTVYTLIRMRITDKGYVGIGTITPRQKLHVIGNILASGTISPSDKRFKEDIDALEEGLESIVKLRPVSYHWNAKGKEQGGDTKEHLGFIAQEIENVLPNLVVTDEKGYKSVNYVEVIPVLTKAIQEQQGEMEKQQQEIQQQQREIQELKILVEQLLKK